MTPTNPRPPRSRHAVSYAMTLLAALALLASPGCGGHHTTDPTDTIDVLAVNATLSNVSGQATLLEWKGSVDGSSQLGTHSSAAAQVSVAIVGVQSDGAVRGNHTLTLTIVRQAGDTNVYRASGVQVQLLRSRLSNGSVEIVAAVSLPDREQQLAAGQGIVYVFTL